jgi:hypothetical protein
VYASFGNLSFSLRSQQKKKKIKEEEGKYLILMKHFDS